MTTEKQSRKTSVLGYTRGLRLSKSSCPGVRYAHQQIFYLIYTGICPSGVLGFDTGQMSKNGV